MTNTTKKEHYLILDGLRGVAAVVVLLFHIFELYTRENGSYYVFSHGYLAVDFFFLLSGFVIAHAYDDRWNRLNLKQFFKRRLIRLHPMILFGMTVGGISYYFSASENLFPIIAETPIWALLLTFLVGCLLLPIPPSMDIRGFGEMYPINGPAWTLFFEYIANILYALFIRKLSTRLLAFFVFLTAIWLAYFSITTGNVLGGWTLTAYEVKAGFIRLLYPFLAGMLVQRLFKSRSNTSITKSTFLICSLSLLLLLAFPKFGDANSNWINGVYEAVAIILLFPIIIFFGASGKIESRRSKKICSFLGQISYPLYIIHYPIVYIFFSYTIDHKLSVTEAIPGGIFVFTCCITLAYFAMKLYDTPLRKYLSKRFIK